MGHLQNNERNDYKRKLKIISRCSFQYYVCRVFKRKKIVLQLHVHHI